MREVIINNCYGGFGLSWQALMWLAAKYDLAIFTALSDYRRYDGRVAEWGVKIALPCGRVLDDRLGCFIFGKNGSESCHFELDRDFAPAIEVVRALGQCANDDYAELKIIEIPSDVDYCIEEYDGDEWVAEVHRTWS